MKIKMSLLSICFILGSLVHVDGQCKFEDLKKHFKNVPNKYRTVPFWVWNYKVTRSEIDRMLVDFKEKGFGGVFVHPRYGMITEYLSDEWFELYEYTLQRAEELGLDVWLYDENAYPSGFAGGLLPSQMPESYTQGQGLLPIQVTFLPDNYADYFVILLERDGYYQDITAIASNFLNKKGNFYLYKKTYYPENTQPSRAWYAGFCYTDLLLPGVTDKFIEITMSGYEKRFSNKFGKSIKGIFSDEINIRSSGGFRWTPDLFKAFNEKYGYDLKEHLPSLHLAVGEWKKVRYDYSKLLLDLFVDRWAKPWYEYCLEHNLIWTGHYWEQTWPGIEQVPDNMAMNAWQQMPGIDMLSNTFEEEKTSSMFGNVRVVKEAKSVANQMGRERLLCEAYGGGGWSMNFKDFKRHSDWLNVMGVNFINQHLSHMSFLGVRKYDWPPMFSSIAPWWNDYKCLNEYLARMSFVMTLGQQKNEILVFEPTTTTWMYAQHIGNDGNGIARKIGNAFQHLVTEFSKRQFEYDLGCEHIIAQNGRVDSGYFIVGECSYSTIVIPEHVENMDSICFYLLKDFVQQGGKLVSFSIPTCINGKKSKEIVQLFKDKRIVYLSNLWDEQLTSLLSSPVVSFIKQEGGNLFHHRRKYQDGELLLLTNSSLSEKTNFSINVKGKSVVELDAFSGEIYTFPHKKENENLIISGAIEPAGSLILYINCENGISDKRKIKLMNGRKNKSLDQVTVKRLRDNVLIIDYLDLIQNDSTWSNQYFFDANFEVFRRAGFKDGNPWFRAVQFKQDIINRDVSSAQGFSTIYSFEILNDLTDLSSLKLLCEQGNMYDISINGHSLEIKGVPYLDKDFILFPIGAYLHTGMNKIEISVSRFNVEAEIEPIYIMGDFAVVKKNNKWVISGTQNINNLGSIKENGAPFYPWEMCYVKSYQIESKRNSYYVSVPKWKGSLVQVWVNGVKAGIVFVEPYCLDITDFIKTGKNNIEIRVVGGMDNFIGPHHNRGSGSTPPWDWQKHSGDDRADGYILSDYGLFEDFNLYQTKNE
ncbi:glycosyl hydrolase [Parabacteroides johnsonii]|uniref:glycosyl hydrolase n=1 Tax=Parabacteroides johnsonii TaxID=387661 RepID=UPI003AB237B7